METSLVVDVLSVRFSSVDEGRGSGWETTSGSSSGSSAIGTGSGGGSCWSVELELVVDGGSGTSSEGGLEDTGLKLGFKNEL